MAPLVFKTSGSANPGGGFDSHPPPPQSAGVFFVSLCKREAVATSNIHVSLLNRASSVLCKPVDGAFTLDGFIDGSLIMVGDKVRVRRRMLPDFEGTVVVLNTHRYIDNFETDSAVVEKGGSFRSVCLGRIAHIQRRAEYRDHWIAIHEVGRLDEDDAHWSSDRLKETTLTASDFHTACVYLAHGRASTAMTLLQSIVARVDVLRASAAKDELTRVQMRQFPRLLKLRVYANVLIGEPFDAVQLCDAARMIEERSGKIEPFDWGGSEQDEYLAAGRAAVIAGCLDYARELLKSTRSFSKHKDQRALLKKLVRKSVAPAEDQSLADRCRHYLDFVRRPHTSNHALFSGNMEWLEWALVVEKFFSDRPSEPLDWRQTVRNVLR